MRVYPRDSQGNTRTYLTTYHPNGQPKQYLEAVNNRAHGGYREWHPEGALKLEAYIIGGDGDLGAAAEKTWLFDGTARVWDENKKQTAAILYEKGSLHGPSIYYHPNGQIWKRVPYEKNQICGKMEIFLENGEIFQTIDYVEGKLHGKSLKYWSGGALAADETYQNDLLVSGVYTNLDGTLASEVKEGKGFAPYLERKRSSNCKSISKGFLRGS